MSRGCKSYHGLFVAGTALLLLAASVGAGFGALLWGQDKKLADPWTSSHAVRADDLARELSDKGGTRLTIVYVGFHTLFAGGHVPGATFHGTASSEQGLADLKKWADTLPRTTDMVIYCGCCPFEKCPNIRPAFLALDKMGFKKLRVLVLPTNFATDWVDKGYPMQKGM
jgi:thiosulfate/3-mercaptopyruvate sulfurtransferase